MLECSLEMAVSVSCNHIGPGDSQQAMSTHGQGKFMVKGMLAALFYLDVK